jgi:pyrroline-5-carboxylate reductase
LGEARKKIGFIGAGNMGEALIKGLLGSKLFAAEDIVFTDVSPERSDYVASRYGIGQVESNRRLSRLSDVIIIAVKPQVIESVLAELKESDGRGEKLFVSIAAGIKIAMLEDFLGSVPIVRVMPNTPALVGRGMSVLSYNQRVANEDREVVKTIFASVGDTLDIDEKLMDAVTAISGSGPAYFFYLIEALVDAGREQDLDEDLATKLAISTGCGSMELLRATQRKPAELRQMVSSKGGTTEAAIRFFDENGMKGIIGGGVKRAVARSLELAGGHRPGEMAGKP